MLALPVGLFLVLSSAPQTTNDQLDVILRVLEEDRSDLPGMIERRRIRVLVPYDRTRFFIDNGRPRGVTYDLFKEYEKHVNETNEGLDTHVAFVPVALDNALSWLEHGYGDVVAPGLTITPEREARVAFTQPLLSGRAGRVLQGAGHVVIVPPNRLEKPLATRADRVSVVVNRVLFVVVLVVFLGPIEG